MELTLIVTPEEYNLIYKGLSKLSIEEALPTLQKVLAQAEAQVSPQNKLEGVKNGRC